MLRILRLGMTNLKCGALWYSLFYVILLYVSFRAINAFWHLSAVRTREESHNVAHKDWILFSNFDLSGGFVWTKRQHFSLLLWRRWIAVRQDGWGARLLIRTKFDHLIHHYRGPLDVLLCKTRQSLATCSPQGEGLVATTSNAQINTNLSTKLHHSGIQKQILPAQASTLACGGTPATNLSTKAHHRDLSIRAYSKRKRLVSKPFPFRFFGGLEPFCERKVPK